MPPKKTRQERASEEMQARLERFCQEHYRDYFERTEYEDMNYGELR